MKYLVTALQVLSSIFVPLLVKKVGASKGLAGMWDAQGAPSVLSEFLGDLNKFVSQVHNTQQQLTGEPHSTVLLCVRLAGRQQAGPLLILPHANSKPCGPGSCPSLCSPHGRHPCRAVPQVTCTWSCPVWL